MLFLENMISMKIQYQNKIYETVYFPFFRVAKSEDYSVFSLRYPSGHIEEMIVFDQNSYIRELIEHLEFLLRE